MDNTIYAKLFIPKEVSDRVYDRYSSFDYCYNYFMGCKGKASENMQMSCMVLWSYLASWGMLRGSTQLFQKNPAVLKGLIESIDKHKLLFDVDIQDYSCGDNRKRIVEASVDFCISLQPHFTEGRKPTITLITKILLGVYSCIPALDNYFCKAIKETSISEINDTLLEKLFAKWEELQIKNLKVKTVDFEKGGETELLYKNAKIFDMWGFMFGMWEEFKKTNASVIPKEDIDNDRIDRYVVNGHFKLPSSLSINKD